MASSISDRPKRGRPATGRDPYLGFRSPAALTEAVDAFVDAADGATRSEAIRAILSDWLATHGFMKRDLDHPEPTGPATEVIKKMDAEIEGHRRGKAKRGAR